MLLNMILPCISIICIFLFMPEIYTTSVLPVSLVQIALNSTGTGEMIVIYLKWHWNTAI